MTVCVECEKRGAPTEGMTKLCADGNVRCLGHVHLTPCPSCGSTDPAVRALVSIPDAVASDVGATALPCGHDFHGES